MAGEMRLDKFLADMGAGTRSQLREAARRGRIRVNGEVCTEADRKVDPARDLVALDQTEFSYVRSEYYMLNKPRGVVSATEDRHARTVVELILEKSRRDLFPVGRLDRDTEGLLLITNDGELAHRLLSPKKHVDKVYLASCAGKVPESAVGDFARGLLLPDGLLCLPAALEILGYDGAADVTRVRLAVREGKFHQVKRMMEAVSCPVLTLKRLSMGPLCLDETLKPGQYRPLTGEELEKLKNWET